MPGENNGNGLARAARLSPQTALLLTILGGGAFAGVGGNAKLESNLELSRETRKSVKDLEESVTKLSTSLTELRARVEAQDKLELDRRLRALEQVGADRRLDALEAREGRK